MKKYLLLACLSSLAVLSATAQSAQTANGLSAKITKHSVPMFVQTNNPVPIAGIVHNDGTNAITSMRINYSVDGGEIQSQVINSIHIEPQENYTFTHNTAWLPAHNGSYTLKIWIDHLNGDMTLAGYAGMLVLKPMASDTVATKTPLYEEFKQASCIYCYQACPNMDSVFVKNKNTCNLIEYHADWPGIDYMNDVTDVPFVNDRVNYYGVENYGVPDGQLDGTTTTDNYDPSSISTANIAAEANLGSPFKMTASATYTASSNTYSATVTVHSYIGTKSTMKLKLRCVLTLDSIKYDKDQSDENPQSGFAPPIGTTSSGGDADNTFKYVTDFPQVAEDMLPDTAGTVINPFTAHTTQSFTLSWVKDHPWGFCPHSNGCVDNGTGDGGTIPSYDASSGDSLVPSNYDSVGNLVHITAFVQSDSSLYVYQSITVAPTAPTAIEDVAPGTQSFTIFPNPTNGIVNVSFELEQTQSTTIEIYNIVGQRLYNYELGKTMPGNHTISIDTKGFAQGVYLVKLTTENNSTTKRLVIE